MRLDHIHVQQLIAYLRRGCKIVRNTGSAGGPSLATMVPLACVLAENEARRSELHLANALAILVRANSTGCGVEPEHAALLGGLPVRIDK